MQEGMEVATDQKQVKGIVTFKLIPIWAADWFFSAQLVAWVKKQRKAIVGLS